jgi:hypothetical protein
VVLCAALAGWLAVAPPCRAQPAAAREDLLKLVPDDFGLCLLVSDLRGHADRWRQSGWAASFWQSPLGRTILDSPEAKQLGDAEAELKKHLGVDWPTLRDEVLGDAVLFAYRPGPPEQPDQEEGMVIVRAARAKLLAQLVERFDELQKASGELKAVQPEKHLGATYYRRLHVKNTHYYYLRGSLLVVTGSEALLRRVIERDLGEATEVSPWPTRFRRAGSEPALATLAVNPRAFDRFIRPAPGDPVQGFAAFWRALDGGFLTLTAREGIELRLSLQGRTTEMPAWAQSLFAPPVPSALWQRFPEPAILTLASRTDFAALGQAFLESLPPAERDKLKEGLHKGLGWLTRLDVFRDVLPNVGPDWGFCVLAPDAGSPLPQVIVALAVKPGSGAERVDEALFKGVQLLAGLAVADFNSKNPATPIRAESVQQGKVAVKFLRQDKLFPQGFRPASAVKDGFLLLASAPEAIARFSRHEVPTFSAEAPLMRVSPPELARLLRLRREQVLLNLRQQQNLSDQEAEQMLDQLLGLLELCDSITLSQHGEPGQAGWSLRLLPRAKASPKGGT